MDGVVQVACGENAAKDIEIAEKPIVSAVGEQNKWEKFLRARYEEFGALTFSNVESELQ